MPNLPSTNDVQVGIRGITNPSRSGMFVRERGMRMIRSFEEAVLQASTGSERMWLGGDLAV